MFKERVAADVFLATEAEVMRSEPILRRVRDEYRVELSASAIRVARRSGTMILDVSIADRDPHHATELCNQLLRTYADYRMMLSTVEIEKAMQFVASELDRKPNDADLVRQAEELQKRRALQENDVRLLEPCVFTR